MKLIHCADLHLDSPMESNLPAEKARERRTEILFTFSELVRHADENQAAAILIAGDLFDAKRTTKRTEQYVLDLMKNHPALHFFYLAGNHDSGNRLTSGSAELPQNLHVFGRDWRSYSIGDLCITGSECPDPDTLDLSEDSINVVLLHGQQKDGNTDEQDVIPFRKYKGKYIDYLALGHLHAYREAPLDDRGVACYSGCLEGRGFDECGRKGYVLLEVENRKIKHTFVPFARRTLHDITCDVTDCDSQLEIENRLLETVAGISAADLVKVTLTGECPPHLLIDLPALRQLLSHRFYFAKIQSRTRLEIHPEDYRHDVSLKGEFVRRVLESNLPDAEKEEIIACGFRALVGEELNL